MFQSLNIIPNSCLSTRPTFRDLFLWLAEFDKLDPTRPNLDPTLTPNFLQQKWSHSQVNTPLYPFT